MPVRLFDAARVPPVVIEAGDYIRFVPVDRATYASIARDVGAGRFVPSIGAPR
jgi:allophanate hydrolase subunit 1